MDNKPIGTLSDMPAIIGAFVIYTLLEMANNRLFYIAVVFAGVGLALSSFLAEVAVTEHEQVQLAIIAAAYRFCSVFVMMIFVISTVVREFNDKCIELYLSMPITRSLYLVGKCTGFIVCGVLLAMIFSSVLLIYSSFSQVLLWTISLMLELALVSVFAFFTAVTFNQQVTTSLFITFFFYLLARASDTIIRISQGDILDDTLGNYFLEFLLKLLILVLPSLERFTKTEWLLYDADYSVIGGLVLQTVIYCLLIGGMSIFDLKRKNL